MHGPLIDGTFNGVAAGRPNLPVSVRPDIFIRHRKQHVCLAVHQRGLEQVRLADDRHTRGGHCALKQQAGVVVGHRDQADSSALVHGTARHCYVVLLLLLPLPHRFDEI